MKPILVVGDAALKITFGSLTGHPRRGREVLASTASMSAAGSGVEFAAAMTRLGRKATLVAKTGSGDMLVNALKGALDVSGLVQERRSRTGLTVAFSDEALVTYPGATADLTLRDFRKLSFRRFGHLHVASPFLLLGLDLPKLIRKARSAGLTVSMGCRSDPRGRNGLGKLDLDVLLTDDPKVGRGTVTVVRKGGKGAHAFTENGRWKTSGSAAGSDFDAGFIHSWLQGDRVQHSLAAAVGRHS